MRNISTGQLTRRPRPVVLTKTDTRADKELADRLLRVFEDDLVMADISGIRFYVRSCTVLMQGLITSSDDRDHLSSIIQQIPGVRSVDNRLQTVQERLSASAESKPTK